MNFDKNELRKSILTKRKNMNINDVDIYSNTITNKLLNTTEFQNSKNVMLYLSFRNEVSTYNLINWCFENNKNVIIPYCIQDKKEIVPCLIKDLETNLVKSSLGVLEPQLDTIERVDINNIDIIIVPGVIFDKNFGRIGFGAGYYDRFLCKREKPIAAVGICYDYQLLDKIPTDEHDIPLDMIITENRIIHNTVEMRDEN